MILSDKAIMSLLKKGTLSISPLQDDQIQPASVDIRLGNTFCVVEDSPQNRTTGICTDGSGRLETLPRQISGTEGRYRV